MSFDFISMLCLPVETITWRSASTWHLADGVMAFFDGTTHDISRAASQLTHVLQDHQLVPGSFPAFGTFPGDFGTVKKPKCSFDTTKSDGEVL